MCCVYFATFSQINNTMYYMDRLPQANYINPAQVPQCKFFLSGLLIPLVGQLPPPVAFAVNTPIDYNDIFFPGRWEYKDSLITPIHPNANLNDFLKKLHPVNYTTFDFHLNLLYFGFKQGEKNFWTFDISEKTYMHFGLPENLIKFVLMGNEGVRNADFTGLHTNLFYYHQVSIGFKRQISRYFNVGTKLKLLTGVANMYSSSSSLIFNTTTKANHLSLLSNYKIHTTVPIEVTLNDEGFIETVDFMDFGNISTSKLIMDYALFTGNTGFALDLGFSKEWNSELTYFVSVEDLGYIRWKNNTHTLSLINDEQSNNEGFIYRGMQVTVEEIVFPTIDSIIEAYDFNYSQEAYNTPLPWKIYGGLQYKLTSKLFAGGVLRFEKLPHRLRTSFTTTLNYRPGKISHFTLSYSHINGNFNNIGFGYSWNLGPFQWYLITDNLIGLGIFPDNSRSAAIRMGSNFIIGYKDKKTQRALPLFNANSGTQKKSYKKSNIGAAKYGIPQKAKKGSAVSAPQD